MSPKIRTKRSTGKKQSTKTSKHALKILRNVGNENSFRFYENIGRPTEEKAESLPEFLNRINTVKLESLQFHLERKDFQNWIKGTLRDPELAERVESVTPTNDEELRTKLYKIVEHRIRELRDTGITVQVKDEITADQKAHHTIV